MIEREFYPLSIAAGIVGYSEDDLIHLGRTGKLKFYIDPANWAKREFNNPVTSNIINVPILIDDPIYLSKLDRGLESIMCFSEQYPDCLLEDLDAIKSEVMGDNPNEFLDPELGIPITRDRLVIMATDLRQLQRDRSESNYLSVHPNKIENNKATQAKPPIIQRVAEFNKCIADVMTEFVEFNGYAPTTVEEVINRMKHRPPLGTIVNFQNKEVSIDGSTPKPIINLERAIKRLLEQQKNRLNCRF